MVSGQKYCERHMHRGRHRSRKLVESSSQKVTDSKATAPNKSTYNLEISNAGSTSVALPMNPALDRINSANRNSNVDNKIMSTALTANVVSGLGSAGAARDSTIFTSSIGTNKSESNSNHKTNGIDDKSQNCSNNANLQNLITRGNKCRNITTASSATFQGLNFSPKSVLQGSIFS